MTMHEEAHGKYHLKSWERGTLWQARAYTGERQVGETEVSIDRATAIANLRDRLNERDALLTAGRGHDGSPSALEYAEAFDRLGELHASYEAMLEAHLNAPDHSLTATELAEAAGYENFNAVNLHYGKLGQMLAVEMGYNPRLGEDGKPVWTSTLADDPESIDVAELVRAVKRREDDAHFEWTLRPQVVEALLGRRGK